MRTLLLLVAIVASFESAIAAPRNELRTRTLSWELLRTANYGQSSKERSAFLVLDANGELQMVMWPWEAESMRASYRGAIPAGTVAIVHTHPNALPNPSPGDAALSIRLELPIYVLTRSSITMTEGGRSSLIARGDWNPTR
jgi:hypothetical protein